MAIVSVSPRFRIVIPLVVRQRLNLKPGDKLTVVEFNGVVRLVPLHPPSRFRGIAKGVLPEVENEAALDSTGRVSNRSIESAITALSKFQNFPAREQPNKDDERESF
jgi:AbrB family looped-hinge helix DNA binding protein